MPAAHAPIEKALSVTSGAVPNAYRAKKAMLRWATSRSRRPRIQLYGVPVEPLDSSIVVPGNGTAPADASLHQPVPVDVVPLLGLR